MYECLAHGQPNQKNKQKINRNNFPTSPPPSFEMCLFSFFFFWTSQNNHTSKRNETILKMNCFLHSQYTCFNFIYSWSIYSKWVSWPLVRIVNVRFSPHKCCSVLIHLVDHIFVFINATWLFVSTQTQTHRQRSKILIHLDTVNRIICRR